MNAPLNNPCSIHPHREAAARCPSCGQDYCRECVSEHAGRLLCASCLKTHQQEAVEQGLSWTGFRRIGEGVAGLALLWFVFYSAGSALVATPTANHEYLFQDFKSRIEDSIWNEEP